MRIVARPGTLAVLACAFAAASFAQDKADVQAGELYQQAKAEEVSGHADLAIEKYKKIIQLDPKLPAAYSNLGRLYYQQGQLEQAIQPLQHASQLDPKLQPPRALLGFVYFQMEDFDKARRELKVAAQLNPADKTARLFLARSMVELQEFDNAVKLLTQLEREEPKNTEVLYTLGNLYSSLAEITINKIQTIDPNSYLLEVVLGKVAEIKQVYTDAAEHYKRAIARAPDVPDLYYKYAHVLWLEGDTKTAMTAYDQALHQNSSDYRALWESGRILLADDPQEALRRADRALALKPDIAGALIIRGRSLLALEKPQEAIAALKKAAEIDVDDPSIHFQLARAYRQAGSPQEAQNENAIFERMDKEAHAAKEQKQPE